MWFRRRKREIADAARRLAEAEQRVNEVVDGAARLERLKAEIAIYTMKPQEEKR